ncbi:MAG: hypothetical protein BroJett010_20790 [Gammaproteobacteria bacterium]|nr:choice-of-anchor D domain-containing protein [Gammaproteobacteria bacterium]GIK35520.1 MAG: hypothetical protein BroJett010_20790 [Gammaproteobacteria bacterium]
MKAGRCASFLAASLLVLAASPTMATAVEIDTANPQNGIFDIYSATFDPALSPCNAGSPGYCPFFGGDPPVQRALVITPNPTTTSTGVPGGINPAPAAGSYLDLTLAADRSTLTLAGGTLRFPVLVITISGSTVVTATGAGFVFDAAPQVAAVNASGQAEFLVNLQPATAVDFSTLSQVVASCTGPLCNLIPLLTLDMLRYRLLIDYDASFGSFTGSFIGQTANNSLVYANLNSGVPDIAVTDSAPPGNDHAITFGDVTELTSATHTLTIANNGGGSLAIGTIGQADGLAAPFSMTADGCSGQRLGLGASCTLDIVFSPGFVGPYSDSLDIPSNDADSPTVSIAVSGQGVAAPVPNIVVTDSVAPPGDGQLPFGTVTVGGLAQQTVTVANNGTADLLLGQLGAAGQLLPPFDLQADGCSNQQLAPGASCTATLRFQPTATGAASASLDIPSNDADTPTALVALSGTGAAAALPDIAITDPTAPADDRSLSFGDVRPSEAYDRVVTVTNAGLADLLLGSVGMANPLAAPFSFVAGADLCSGATLPPAASCTIRLRFTPAAATSYSDSFDIPSNDPDTASATVAVAGNGYQPPPTASPSPSGASSGFMGLDAGLLGLLAGAALLPRRRRAPAR